MDGSLKSLDCYVLLFEALIVQDLTRTWGMQALFLRDFETLKRRSSCEGLSFLTKTLPKFGKEIDQALLGKPLNSRFFRSIRGSSLPVFLQGLTRYVFDDRGEVLPNPSYAALNDLRQVCFLLYKLELPYAEKLQHETINRFVEYDQGLHGHSDSFKDPFINTFENRVLREGRSLITAIFGSFVVRNNDFRPKHGPGAVATGEQPFDKFNFKRYYADLAQLFPYEENFFCSPTHLVDHLDDFLNFEELEKGTSKVVLVPKDSRGPRLIAMEPLEYQWIQQGIKDKLYNHIESHELTAGYVNFTNQNVNRDLALVASSCQNYATLDMKDASDSVTVALVKDLLPSGCDLLQCLMHSRSTEALLPDGRRIVLNKFAPMGSAVCFPVEAIVFWALASAYITVWTEGRVKGNKVVYVYGDDIIVPNEYAKLLIEGFPHFGLLFNQDKCCYSGNFRESCGCDAFFGEDVTPIKIKSTLTPLQKHDGRKLVSLVAISNRLWEKCFYATSEYISRLIVKEYGDIPYGLFSDAGDTYESPTLLRRFVTDSKPNLPIRYNKKLQRYEIKALVTKTVRKIVPTDSWSELFRSFFKTPEQLAGHYDLPNKVKLVKKWVYNPQIDITLKGKRCPRP